MDQKPPADEPTDYEPARIRPRGRFNLIWLVPIVAALAAGWLAYKTLSERGPLITITFVTADGLEAGKTRVKHKNVDVGMVETVELSHDLSRVLVTARMNRDTAFMLTDRTRFWVVRPRITASGISGLGTLVSGAYIEMDPEKGGDEKHDFVGLEDPPVVSSSVPGSAFLLKTRRLGGIGGGSPVFYHGIQVGEVLGYDFHPQTGDMTVHAFVAAPYDKLVHTETRFWNAAGVSISMGSNGLKVQVESLEAVLLGGIAFDTPPGIDPGKQVQAGGSFKLYDSEAAMREAGYTEKLPFRIYFDSPLNGMDPGTPVQIRGLDVGKVTDIRLEFDTATSTIRTPVSLEIEPERMSFVGERPTRQDAIEIIRKLVEQGLRAQLQTSNLLTGDQVVVFETFPDAPPAKVTFDADGTPILPHMPTDRQAIMRSIQTVLSSLSSLPLDALAGDVRDTLKAAQALLTAPEMRRSLKSLDEALSSVDKLSKSTERQAGPLLQDLRSAVTEATSVLKQMDLGGPLNRDLRSTLAEIRDAARSIRVLVDMIDNQPEVLLRGKKKDASE